LQQYAKAMLTRAIASLLFLVFLIDLAVSFLILFVAGAI